jgi:hypothetical protein
VGEADGEGIGFIGGGVVAKTEQGTRHEGDLLFFCSAFSGGGFLNEFRRIFVDGESASGGGEEGDTPSGAEDDGGAGVLNIDDEFNGESRWRVL